MSLSNMTDTTNELDEILNKTFAYGVDWTEYKDKSEHDHDTSVFAAKIKAEQKEALKQEINALIQAEIVKARVQERNRWITPIQRKVLVEINATLSPTITTLINNTKLGNSTVQKALKKLIDVGLVYREGYIYKSNEDGKYTIFNCGYGCKNAGLHY